MARKSQEEQIGEWLDHRERGLQYRRTWGRPDEWEAARNKYRGIYEEETFPMNYNYPMARTMRAHVYFQNPRIVVTPYRPDMIWNARLLEQLANSWLHVAGIKQQVRAMVLDNHFCGVGIGKQGYDSEFGFNQKHLGEEFLGLGIKPLSEGTTSLFDKKGRRIEYNTFVSSGMPWFLRLDPASVVVPYGTASIRNARWIMHLVLRHIDDVKADPKYENTADLNTGSLASIADFIRVDVDSEYFANMDKEGYILLNEVHDAKTGRVMVFVEGHKKWLRNEVDVLQFPGLGLPFEELNFNFDNKHFWSVSDSKLMDDMQSELNETQTQAQHFRQSAVLRLLIRKGLLDPEELEKFLNSTDAVTVLETEQDIQDLRSAVFALQLHIPQDMPLWGERIKDNIQEILGFGRNQMGQYAPGRRSATEAQRVGAGADVNVAERRDQVGDMIVNIARRFFHEIWEFWTDEKISWLVGPDNALYWVSFKGRGLVGDYAVQVEPDSTLPLSRRQVSAESLQMLQILSRDQLISPEELHRVVTAQLGPAYDPARLMRQQGPPPGGQINTLEQLRAGRGQAAQIQSPVSELQ